MIIIKTILLTPNFILLPLPQACIILCHFNYNRYSPSKKELGHYLPLVVPGRDT